MDDKFRSRKFGLSLLAISLASLFLGLGKLTGGEWVTVVTLVLGLYAGANVWEKKQ